jgi:hypothetical protein
VRVLKQFFYECAKGLKEARTRVPSPAIYDRGKMPQIKRRLVGKDRPTPVPQLPLQAAASPYLFHPLAQTGESLQEAADGRGHPHYTEWQTP